MNAFVDKVIRADVRALSAYQVLDATGMVKLDVMENPYRLPEWLAKEVATVVQDVAMNRYPIPTAPELRSLMRGIVGAPDGTEILLGNGSDEVILNITQAVSNIGAKVLAPVPAFPMYKAYAMISHMPFIGVPLRADFTLDLELTLAAIKEHQPALVWLAYPNNPTGNLYPEAAVDAIIKAAPGLVVLDEAYQPFAKHTYMHRLHEFDNLLVMRTFSKIGLAGLRLGYVVGAPAWIQELDKVRAPYNVNVLTQAIAHTLLLHKSVLDAQCAAINSERERAMHALQAVKGVTTFPSAANFILARVNDAPKVYAALKESNVLVKSFHGAHPLLAHCLRLTIGTPDETSQLIAALTKACA